MYYDSSRFVVNWSVCACAEREKADARRSRRVCVSFVSCMDSMNDEMSYLTGNFGATKLGNDL